MSRCVSLCGVRSTASSIWRRAGRVAGAEYFGVYIDAAWLSALPSGELIEESETTSSDTRNVVLNQKKLQSADVSAGKDSGGRTYHLFDFRKSFLPTKPGKQTLPAATMKFTVASGVRRDAFSMFPTRSTKDYFVYGEPIEIEILPLPKVGRPDPYFGAVGRFEVRASLDKSRAKVGQSVKLTLTITGTGNLQQLQLPKLAKIEGFHSLDSTVNRTREKVIATYDLTPLNAEISQLPGIAWNFFDTTPGVEKYVSVRTDPLSIKIEDVEGGAALSTLPGENTKAVVAGVDDIFDIQLDPSGSLAVKPRSLSAGFVWGALAAPWIIGLLSALFWRSRQRADADVTGRRARGASRQFERSLSAGVDPIDALTSYVADRLGCESAAVIEPELAVRLEAGGVAAELAMDVQQTIEAGVAARYGGGGGIDAARVREVVRAFESGPSSVSAKMMGWLLPLLLASGAVAQLPSLPSSSEVSASPQATGGDFEVARKAYRAREYEKAAKIYAGAAARGNRAAYYNLGNCRFRQGQMAHALVAYESARLAMPRDPELLANIQLVERRLDLGTGGSEPFLQTLTDLRDRFTPRERLWVCVFFNALAALLLCFGGKRLRLLGLLVLIPAIITGLEVAWFGPNRPPKGIVVAKSVDLRAEPDASLDSLMKLRSGVAVDILHSGGEWLQVRVKGRRAYAPAKAIELVE